MQPTGQYSTTIYVNSQQQNGIDSEPIYSNYQPPPPIESPDKQETDATSRLPPPIKPRTSLLKRQATEAAVAVAAQAAANAVAATTNQLQLSLETVAEKNQPEESLENDKEMLYTNGIDNKNQSIDSTNNENVVTNGHPHPHHHHHDYHFDHQIDRMLTSKTAKDTIETESTVDLDVYDEPVKHLQPPNFPPPPLPPQTDVYDELDQVPTCPSIEQQSLAQHHHYHEPQLDSLPLDDESDIESDHSGSEPIYSGDSPLSSRRTTSTSGEFARIDAQLQKQLLQLDQKLNELTADESLLGEEPIYGRILPVSRTTQRQSSESSAYSPPLSQKHQPQQHPPPIPPRSAAMMKHRPRLLHQCSEPPPLPPPPAQMLASMCAASNTIVSSSSPSPSFNVELTRSSSSCSSSSSKLKNGRNRIHKPMIGIISPLVRTLSRSSFSLDRKAKSSPKQCDIKATDIQEGSMKCNDGKQSSEFYRKMSNGERSIAGSDISNGKLPTSSRLQDEREFMFKTGPARKQFYRRWCTLDEHALSYFNDQPPPDKNPPPQPNGRLQLNDVLFVGRQPQSVLLRKGRLARALKSMRGSGSNGQQVDTLELQPFNVGVCADSGRTFLFAADSENTRRQWLNALAVRIRPILRPAAIVYDTVDACGYVNLKLGVSGLWTRCWVVLKQRLLLLQLLDVPDTSPTEQLLQVDLRKVTHITPTPTAPVEPCAAALEPGQPFVLGRHIEHSLYLQADYKAHTQHWLTLLQAHWTLPENGVLELQLLSTNDVPLAVEKCLNFICTYGGLGTKGLYSNGTCSSNGGSSNGNGNCELTSDAGSVLTIFNQLKGGSLFDWHIKPEDGYTVFDVAEALKMYLSSFPECILTEQLYPEFIRLAASGNSGDHSTNGNLSSNNINNNNNTASNVATVQPIVGSSDHPPTSDLAEAQKLVLLRDLLQRLPNVNRSCLRKLLGHLVCVLECSELNHSQPEQVASAMASALIYSNISASVCSRLAEQLLLTLLRFYAWLFQVQPHELEKERKIQRTLLALRNQRPSIPHSPTVNGSQNHLGKLQQQPSADMLVGVYLNDRQTGPCVNVRISSTMTADDLLAYVIRHAKLPDPPTQLAVFEVVASEQLHRPLHYSESILELVYGWATRWPPDDARGNYLIVRQNALLELLQPHLSRSNARHSSIPLNLFNELRFSDFGAGRSFRRVMLELVETRCSVYKDAKASKTLASWQLDECLWYIGCETKRSPPTKNCLTFVPRRQMIERSKDTQGFVGRVFACTSQDELYKWIAGLITAEHPNGQQPIISSLNLLD